MDRKSSKVCQSFVPRDTFQTNMNTWKKEWKWTVKMLAYHSCLESAWICFEDETKECNRVLLHPIQLQRRVRRSDTERWGQCVCVCVGATWLKRSGAQRSSFYAHLGALSSSTLTNQNQPIGSQKERIKVPLIDTLRRISSINTFTGQGGFVRKPYG